MSSISISNFSFVGELDTNNCGNNILYIEAVSFLLIKVFDFTQRSVQHMCYRTVIRRGLLAVLENKGVFTN